MDVDACLRLGLFSWSCRSPRHIHQCFPSICHICIASLLHILLLIAYSIVVRKKEMDRFAVPVYLERNDSVAAHQEELLLGDKQLRTDEIHRFKLSKRSCGLWQSAAHVLWAFVWLSTGVIFTLLATGQPLTWKSSLQRKPTS